MKFFIPSFKFSFVALFVALSMCACVDREFDAPPIDGNAVSFPDDSLMTIGEVKAYYSPGEFVQIPDAKFMRGVVVGDDESGNIFKSLILQDSIDGITLIVDAVNLNNNYFEGREVIVYMEGLWISDFNGFIQVGAGPNSFNQMERIPEILVNERVRPGKYLGVVEPILVTFTQLNDSYQSRLIKVDGVEFASFELGKTYAEEEQTINLTIQDCNGSDLLIRTSGFSDFWETEVPQGNGSITAIYGVFGQDQQLTIRDLNDVEFINERCDGGGGSGGANAAFDENGNFIVESSRVVSIADLKAEFYQAGSANFITSDRVIRGTVTSSDLEGNFFKEITFEDASGGIKVRIDAFDLFQTYPIGTDVALFAQGLAIGDFNGLVQIGGGADGADILRIDEGVYRSHLFAGSNVGALSGTVVAIADLDDSYQNRLVRIEATQFANGSVGVPYSESDFTTNRNIEDCDGNSILLRNSSFADFAADDTPEDNGTITAVYGVFGTDQQLFIRDTRDVNYTGTRCDGGGGGNEGQVSVQSLRDAWSSGSTSAPEGYINGVVISDFANGNMTGRNLVVQDGDYGIVIRLSDVHSVPLNSEIKVVVSSLELSEFNGLLQVNNVPTSNLSVESNSGSVTPKEMTVAEILADFENLESTLVTIKGASLSGQSTFAGDVTLDDGTGTIELFTRNDATFSGDALPDEADLTLIVSEYEMAQVLLRNSNDISSGGGGGGGGSGMGFSEDFEGGIDFDPFSPTGWSNIAVQGDRLWLKRSFDGNGYVEAKGFDEDLPNIDTWLITPSFDLADASTLTFESTVAYYTHGGLSVWVSPEFTNLDDAVWTQLNPTLYDSNTDNYDFVASGDVSIPGSGRVRIGFKYEGNNSSNTESVQIDNLVVK